MGRELLSFVNNPLLPSPRPPSVLDIASAPAFSRTWISVQIAARSASPELGMRSPVPAVASPSMCEVRGLYAATGKRPSVERGSSEDLNISWIREGDPEAGNQALLALGRNLKGRI